VRQRQPSGAGTLTRNLLRQAAAVTLGVDALARRPAYEKPNLVFILIDDLGWSDLGCYGSAFYETPNTDRLASQGMRFTNAYAASPVCSRTRASILTGRYPLQTGSPVLSPPRQRGLRSTSRRQPPRTRRCGAGKGYLYEGGIRVPLIVRWPGVVRAGALCDVPVSSVDFIPTMSEIAGLSPTRGIPVVGGSFVPELRGSRKPRDRALYWHYPHYDLEGAEPGSAIREANYKLIEFQSDGRRELYDLEADIGETNNLAGKLPEKAKRLHEMLADWREAAGAGGHGQRTRR